MGEFFYRNKIDFRGLVNFPSSTDAPIANRSPLTAPRSPRLLIPLGGGKDSIVTVEMLRELKLPMTLLRVGEHPLITALAKEMGLPILTIERKLPAELFKLNAEGALNGHVPITTILWFLADVVAELLGYSHVIWSNERSANEGNTELYGMKINHQWSKSLEAEIMLQSYEQRFIAGSVQSFSLLRPFSELSIVEKFTKFPQYFPLFTSCNTNWKISSTPPPPSSSGGGGTQRGGGKLWCNSCPKCAFAFVMLAAFLPKSTLLDIFQKNLFEDQELLPMFRELLGLEGQKPFECVGTPEETFAALLLADERGEWERSAVMKMFHEEAQHLFAQPEDLVRTILTPSQEHFIPKEFSSIISSS